MANVLDSDPNQILQAAQAFADQQDYARALGEYDKLLQANPNDTKVLLLAGDLRARLGQFEAAIGSYVQAAVSYAQQGVAIKAIAVYKQVRELIRSHTPHLADNYVHLVEHLTALYGEMGLVNDALRTLDEEANRLREAGRDDDALLLFRKMTDVGANIPLPYLRLGEGLYRVGEVDEALTAFWSATQLLLANERKDDALRVIERMLHVKAQPKHAKVAARLYLEKGTEAEGMQALSRLQLCFQADPADLETLQLLAQAFDLIGHGERSLEVQKELARLAHEQGQPDIFAQATAQLQERAPEDEHVQQLLAMPSPEAKPRQKASAGPPAPSRPAPSRPASSGPASSGPAPSGPAPSGPAPSGATSSSPEAVRHSPTPTPPPKPVGRGSTAPPAVALSSAPPPLPVTLNTIPPPSPTRAAPLAQPGTAPTPPPRRPPPIPRSRVGGTPPPPPPPSRHKSEGPKATERTTSPADPPSASRGLFKNLDEVLANSQKALEDAHTYRGLGLFHKGIETVQSALDYDPRSIQLREVLRDLYTDVGDRDGAITEMLTMAEIYVEFERPDHALAVLTNILEEEPNCDEAHARVAELREDFPEMFSQPPPAPSVAPEPVAAPSSRAPVPPPPPPAPSSSHSGPSSKTQRSSLAVPPPQPSLEEALEQVEAFAERGMSDEARRMLDAQAARFPDHPLIAKARADLEETIADSQAPAALVEDASAKRPGDSLDLDLQTSLAELGQAVRESMRPPAPGERPALVDVDVLFDKFKASVKEQVADNDAATHYDLGLAYKDMGMLDDAIEEFELASSDASHECECLAMIGLIYAEQQMWDKACKAYSRALGSSNRTPKQETRLYYDLGHCSEMGDQLDQAIYYFRQVLRRDQDYEDTAQRVQQLRAKRQRTPSGRPKAQDAEVDRAFEGLLGD